MKQFLFAATALLVLVAFVFVPGHSVFADTTVECSSNPASGAPGTIFEFTCSGFTPNSMVYAYLVEPFGAARPLPHQEGGLKIDEHGTVTFTLPSRFFDAVVNGDATFQVGTWTFVADELGPARTIMHHGQVEFKITGGAESVSGAALQADPATIHKPAQGYAHFNVPEGQFNFPNSSEPVTLTGTGFEAGEMVSFWLEPANGGCASLTEHQSNVFQLVSPGIITLFLDEDFNTPIYNGLGAQYFTTVKADESGQARADAYFTMLACEGMWHFVARGNTSHRGAETWVTVIGNSVTVNASLTADRATVPAMFGTVSFHGEGFAPQEQLSCWLTSPHGSTLGFPSDTFFTGTFSEVTYRDHVIHADANGSFNFQLVTGNEFAQWTVTEIVNGQITVNDETVMRPRASEGALGEYAMTCRGITSQNSGIARFTVTGGMIDP